MIKSTGKGNSLAKAQWQEEIGCTRNRKRFGATGRSEARKRLFSGSWVREPDRFMQSLRSHTKACGLHPKALESLRQIFIKQLLCVKIGLDTGCTEESKSGPCPLVLYNLLLETDVNPTTTEQINDDGYMWIWLVCT